jgi:hypothetical protein
MGGQPSAQSFTQLGDLIVKLLRGCYDQETQKQTFRRF